MLLNQYQQWPLFALVEHGFLSEIKTKYLDLPHHIGLW